KHKVTPDQFKVNTFLYRHTLGFGKFWDYMSISQFRDGTISRKTGKQLHYGTGLCNETIINSLRHLKDKRLVSETAVSKKDIRKYGKCYSLDYCRQTKLFVKIENFWIDEIMPRLSSMEWYVYLYIRYYLQFYPNDRL